MTLLLAIGGHTGTGKTTLAHALRAAAPFLRDALVVEDDHMRRRMLARSLREKMRPEDYAPDVSLRVRAALDDEIAQALRSGRSVIDASGFFRKENRRAIEKLAHDAGAGFAGLFLVAPRHVMEERIVKRLAERESGQDLSVEQGHASDACLGVIDKFGDVAAPASDLWAVIDADGSPDHVLALAMERLSAHG